MPPVRVPIQPIMVGIMSIDWSAKRSISWRSSDTAITPSTVCHNWGGRLAWQTADSAATAPRVAPHRAPAATPGIRAGAGNARWSAAAAVWAPLDIPGARRRPEHPGGQRELAADGLDQERCTTSRDRGASVSYWQPTGRWRGAGVVWGAGCAPSTRRPDQGSDPGHLARSRRHRWTGGGGRGRRVHTYPIEPFTRAPPKVLQSPEKAHRLQADLDNSSAYRERKCGTAGGDGQPQRARTVPGRHLCAARVSRVPNDTISRNSANGRGDGPNPGDDTGDGSSSSRPAALVRCSRRPHAFGAVQRGRQSNSPICRAPSVPLPSCPI